MSEPFYIDGYDAGESAVSPIRAIAPFAEVGDLSDLIFEQEFECLEADYAPIALDTPHPTIADAYLVADGLNSTVELGVKRWTRRYAKIPSLRKDYESYAWTVPGLSRGGLNAISLVAGYSISDPAAGYVTIETTTAHGLSAGDRFFSYYLGSTNAYKPQSLLATSVDSVPDSTHIVVFVSGAQPFQSLYAIQKVGEGRSPLTKSVSSEIRYEYFMPGVSPGIATVDDIEILTQPAVLDVDSQKMDPPTYSLESTPDITEYADQIADKTKIVAADSIIRRWQGNIYERATRYVTAQ